jgi:hypothetical protein
MRRESLHGSEPVDSHVEAVLVVVSQKVGQGARPRDGRRVGAGVGPFRETGANEAFGLAVGLRPVGPGPVVAQAQPAAQDSKPEPAIGTAVVGQEGRTTTPRVANQRWTRARKAAALAAVSSGKRAA